MKDEEIIKIIEKHIKYIPWGIYHLDKEKAFNEIKEYFSKHVKEHIRNLHKYLLVLTICC